MTVQEILHHVNGKNKNKPTSYEESDTQKEGIKMKLGRCDYLQWEKLKNNLDKFE